MTYDPGLPGLHKYRKVTEYSTSFELGELPDWMTVDLDEGADYTVERGELIMETSDNQWDGLDVIFGDGPFALDEWDAIAITTEIDGNADDTIWHQRIHGSDQIQNVISSDFLRIQFDDGSEDISVNIPEKDLDWTDVEYTLVWDIKAGYFYSLVGGMVSEFVYDTPDPESSHEIRFAHYVNSDSDGPSFEASMYGAKLEFYRQ